MRKLPILFSALLWMVGGILVFRVAYQTFQGTVDKIEFVGTLLAPQAGDERWLPYLIVALFAWVLADLGLRTLRLVRERSALGAFLRANSLDALPGQSIREDTAAGRRRELVSAYLKHQNREGLHDTLPGAAGADTARVEESFSQIRALLWAIPVLGFIGTALGLAGAIGGFSAALKVTDINNQKLIVETLGHKVIPSLAGAFSVTMLALGATAIGHVCQSTLATSFHDLLQDLDNKCMLLLGAVPRGGGSGALLPELAKIRGILERILQELDTSPSKDAAHELNASAQALQSSAQTLTKSSTELGEAAQQIMEAATLPYNITITRGERR